MAYVKNNWVDREGQTRYHETIDDDGALIFTPDYEKVTEIGTPVNADNMNHIEDGIVDHENRITVLEEAGDASNFLNKSQITNCLLEVPQNIKLELNNGTLTLKAGSVLIVPYGVEDLTSQYPIDSVFINDNFKVYDTQFENGKFFVRVELVRDILHAPLWGQAGLGFTFIDITSTAGASVLSTRVHSGDIEPTREGSVGFWYDTANNYIKRWGSSGFVDVVSALPILTVNFDTLGSDNNYTASSIDQVFNGMGYIGSTFWIDKDVKFLVPNGRNKDGSLNNIEYTTSSIRMSKWGVYTKANALLFRAGDGTIVHSEYFGEYTDEVPPPSGPNATYFNPRENIVYYNDVDHWVVRPNVILGEMYADSSGVITGFNPKQPIRLVDHNDLRDCEVVIETYQNGASWYRVWSDGWCEQGGLSSNIGVGANVTVSLLKKFSNTNYSLLCNWLPSGSVSIDDNPIPNSKTTTDFKIYGTVHGANDGYSLPAQWYACGYIA